MEKQKQLGIGMLPVIIIVGLIALIGGLYVYNQKQMKSTSAVITPEQPTSAPVISNESPTGVEATGTVVKEEKTTAMAEKVVDVNGGMFYFDPKEITVKQGEKVTIKFHNKQGMHNWTLDEFNAKTKTIGAGETDTVSFVADKTGTFEYYCSVGNHRAMGMKGNLIVE